VTPFNYPAGIFEAGDEITLQDLTSRVVSQAQRHLDQTLPPELDGVTVTRVLLRGDPAREIVKAAFDRNVDLIMMSTRGHAALYRFLLGSVTAKALHEKRLPGLDGRSSGRPGGG
jgi:nucleotide-binding universal stress UspA family protein